jgi:hypothetical protein
MGEAKRRNKGIGVCVYCGSRDKLSDEHVLPYALGGNLVLQRASCEACRIITGSLEQKLLRGHWWPQRYRTGLQSRTKHKERMPVGITIIQESGSELSAQLPLEEQTVFIEFGMAAPSVLQGRIAEGEPFSTVPTMRFLGKYPNSYFVGDQRHWLKSKEQIRLPIDFSAVELTRFLAKVAHCYALSKRGMDCCSEFFLPKIVLGHTDGASTYVGGASSEVIGKRLPGNELHALLDRRNGDFLTVYIQLFRLIGDPPPIYEVVVGRIRQ